MNRVLKRPMFRIGGSAGTGITSGLDTPRKKFENGTDPFDRALSTTERAMKDLQKFRGEKKPLLPGSLPSFLTSFGLNLASATPTGTGFGGLAATAAKAAQQPFQTFQAAKLAERDDRYKSAEDIFTGALASEYDILAKKEGADADSRKTAEVERGIIETAQNEIFKQRDIIADEDSTDEQKKAANRIIKVQQNVLVKELGVPAEYAAIISSQELFDAEMTTVVNTYNESQKQKQKDYLDANPDKTPEDALTLFPNMVDGTAAARALTFEDLKKRFYYNEGGRAGFTKGGDVMKAVNRGIDPTEALDLLKEFKRMKKEFGLEMGFEDYLSGEMFAKGGRAGYRMGSEPMMESVAESKRQTGEVQDLSYTELRARLPQEVSNDIVQLLANSKQALLDFANIQTGEDIASFNQQYDVNLSLPQGA